MAANPFNAIRVGGQCHTRHRIQLLVDTYENGGLERCTPIRRRNVNFVIANFLSNPAG